MVEEGFYSNIISVFCGFFFSFFKGFEVILRLLWNRERKYLGF